MHPYAIENNLRAWSSYFEVYENDVSICECFEIRPLKWFAISGDRLINGNSRKSVIHQIKGELKL
jgi:hypothetical protein